MLQEENNSMQKRWIYYISIIAAVAFIGVGFKPFKEETYDWFKTDETTQLNYEYPSENRSSYTHLNIPFTGRYFIGYKEALAFKESQGKYSKINTFGYLGKYQFGVNTLKELGIHDSMAFLRSPKLQEKAFIALLAKNKWELREEIEKYCGTVVGGVYVTESGILAAAHLGGVGSVKRFFKTNGERHFKDGYGTSIKTFMKKFAGYETGCIKPDSNAKVTM